MNAIVRPVEIEAALQIQRNWWVAGVQWLAKTAFKLTQRQHSVLLPR